MQNYRSTNTKSTIAQNCKKCAAQRAALLRVQLVRPCGGRYLEYPRVPSTSVLGGGGGPAQIILCSLAEENFKGEKDMSTLGAVHILRQPKTGVRRPPPLCQQMSAFG